MPDRDPRSILEYNLLDLPGIRQLRRRLFLRNVGGDRGATTRNLFLLDLAEAVRHKTPLDQALEVMARGHQAAGLPFSPFSWNFKPRYVDPAKMTRLLAWYMLPMIRRGMGLSQAMQSLKGTFTRQDVEVVRMGEAGGRLAVALDRLAEFRQTDGRLRSLKRYLNYPIYLACLATFLVGFIINTIMPKFQAIFDELGGGLPAATQAVINYSGYLVHHIVELFIALLILWLLYVLVDSLRRRSRAAPLVYYVPFLGGLHRAVHESRWLAALSLALDSGATADSAIRQAGAIFGGYLESRSGEAARLVEQGHPIGEACVRARVLSSWINHRLCLIDWRAGYVEHLRAIVEDADRGLRSRFMRAGRRLDVASILAIACIVGSIVIAIYLPLFSIPSLIPYYY